MDTRADATGIANGLLALVVGAIMMWLFTQIGTPVHNRARNATSNATLNAGTGWLETFQANWPLLVLLLFVFSLLALAVFQREVFR